MLSIFASLFRLPHPCWFFPLQHVAANLALLTLLDFYSLNANLGTLSVTPFLVPSRVKEDAIRERSFEVHPTEATGLAVECLRPMTGFTMKPRTLKSRQLAACRVSD